MANMTTKDLQSGPIFYLECIDFLDLIGSQNKKFDNSCTVFRCADIKAMIKAWNLYTTGGL